MLESRTEQAKERHASSHRKSVRATTSTRGARARSCGWNMTRKMPPRAEMVKDAK